MSGYEASDAEVEAAWFYLLQQEWLLLGCIPNRDDMRGALAAAAAVREPVLMKRPVAWQVKNAGGEWILYDDEEAAYHFSEANNFPMRGLYYRGNGDRKEVAS